MMDMETENKEIMKNMETENKAIMKNMETENRRSKRINKNKSEDTIKFLSDEIDALKS